MLCDSACSHSCLSSDLARRLNLTGDKIEITVKRFNSTKVIASEQVDLTVAIEFDPEKYFFVCAYVKYDINLGPDLIKVSNLQENYLHLEHVSPVEF